LPFSGYPSYLAAFRAALWYEIGVLLLTATLMALLPPSTHRTTTDDTSPGRLSRKVILYRTVLIARVAY
jgi:hypothetical protein